jgi:hypothetical protein
MNKARRKEPRGGNIEELRALGLGHFKVGRVRYLHNKIIKI